MIAFALDSQEATFIKQRLQASDSLYGIIVSIAGIGASLVEQWLLVMLKGFQLDNILSMVCFDDNFLHIVLLFTECDNSDY